MNNRIRSLYTEIGRSGPIEWVIAQGKDFYQKTIKNPESLINVDKDEIENADWEGLGYIPPNVFKELTGQEMPNAFMENREITGIEWKEEGDDLKRMFPELYAKYSGNTWSKSILNS